MAEIDPRLGKQLDVDECIEQSVKEDCTCEAKGVVPAVGWINHAEDCPVFERQNKARIERRAATNDPGKPLSAEDVVRRKLEGK